MNTQLDFSNGASIIPIVVAKSTTGIDLPKHHKAHRRLLEERLFCVRVNGGLCGGSSERRILVAGKVNPVQPVAYGLTSMGDGKSNRTHKEAPMPNPTLSDLKSNPLIAGGVDTLENVSSVVALAADIALYCHEDRDCREITLSAKGTSGLFFALVCAQHALEYEIQSQSKGDQL